MTFKGRSGVIFENTLRRYGNMKTKKMTLVSAVALAMTMLAGTALAGEWNQKGDVAAKTQGNSLCLFNGLDEPDITEDHAGGDPDDGLWSSTPAGANSGGKVLVQSGGQMIAFRFPFVAPGDQGESCNPTTPSPE
ncbi:MAG: hypothetical protein ACI9UU_002691 [Candidatus Azotimanducaceae bacterium]